MIEGSNMHIKVVLSFLFMFQAIAAKSSDPLATRYCQWWNWVRICDFSYQYSSDPYIRKVSDSTPINPAQIPAGSIIFVTGLSVDSFFAHFNPKIKHPYILVSMMGGVLEKYLDEPNVIAWFANDQGSIQKHPKFHLIPLGLYQDKTISDRNQEMLKTFQALQQRPKKKLLYMNFNIHPDYETRNAVYNFFKDKPFVFIGQLAAMGQRKPFLECMKELSKHKFNLSPAGDMLDCYRHWESIAVGTIPIIKHGPLDKLFEGLPVLFVDRFEDITEEFLNAKYEEMSHRTYDIRKIFIKHWADKIYAIKRTFNRHY